MQHIRSSIPYLERQSTTRTEQAITETKAESEPMRTRRVTLADEQTLQEEESRLVLEESKR